MSMEFEIFRGTLVSWQELFQMAATFATELGPARVRRVSHSASGGRGIVVVWYTSAESSAGADLMQTQDALPIRLSFFFHQATMISWPELFEHAAAKAMDLHPDQVVSVSHSDDQGKGLVALWYWDASADVAQSGATSG